MFWTPVKKISSTKYIDEGTVRYFNDTSPNLGLMFGANRWDDDRTSTAYDLVHFKLHYVGNTMLSFMIYL